MKHALWLPCLLAVLALSGCAWETNTPHLPNDNDEMQDTNGDGIPDDGNPGSDNNDSNDDVSSGSGNALTPNGEECYGHADCQSGNCFFDGVCRPITWKNPDGRKCLINDHCASNFCHNGTCSPSDDNGDSGNTGNNGGSGENLDNSLSTSPYIPCNLNSDCDSKVCVNNLCAKLEPTKLFSNDLNLPGSKQTGDSCTYQTECESGLCFNNRCSDDCDSIGCYTPYTVCRHNKCIPVNAVGNECKTALDCNFGESCCSGFCKVDQCEPGVACGSETEGGRLTSKCWSACITTPWGSACGCEQNADCGLGYYCELYEGETKSEVGMCLPRKAQGEPCSRHEQCQSHECVDSRCYD